MLKRIFLGFVIMIALVGVMFFSGGVKLLYKKTFGVANANVDREIFKSNKIYTEGMASDLAKYKYEYTTGNEVEKSTIKMFVIEKYANFDSDKLESNSLRTWLNELTGNY